MSAFLPAIEVCLSDAFYRGADSIHLKPGQWVTCKGTKGRVTDSETLRILWRHAGESFQSFNLRFKKALSLRKGIKRASGALRGVVHARRMMQMQFTDAEPGVMTRAVLTAHQRLAALRVQYQACEKGRMHPPLFTGLIIVFPKKGHDPHSQGIRRTLPGYLFEAGD